MSERWTERCECAGEFMFCCQTSWKRYREMRAELERLKAERVKLAERVRTACVHTIEDSLTSGLLIPAQVARAADQIRSLDLTALTSEQGS